MVLARVHAKCVNEAKLTPGCALFVPLVGCKAQPIQGLGRGDVGVVVTVSDVGVVHIFPSWERKCPQIH